MLEKLEKFYIGRNVKAPLVYKQVIFICHGQVKLHEWNKTSKRKDNTTTHFAYCWKSK